MIPAGPHDPPLRRRPCLIYFSCESIQSQLTVNWSSANHSRNRLYSPGFIEFVRLCRRILGSWANFTAFFSPVLLLLQLIGFYLLGRELLGSRWAGLGLSLLSLCYFTLPRGTYIGWRGYAYVTPRTFFLSLSPFAVFFLLRFRQRLSAWFVAMAMMGALAWVHPVSAPVVAFGLWLGCWVFHPAGWRWRRRTVVALACGAIFLAVVAPYAFLYGTNVTLGKPPPSDMSCEEVIALGDRCVADLFEVVPTMIATFRVWITPPLGYITTAALAGAALGLAFRRTRKIAAFCLLWTAGIWFTSFVVPWADKGIQLRMGNLPSQVSLVRGMRNVAYPLMTLALLLPIATRELAAHLRRPRWLVILLWGGVALAPLSVVGLCVHLSPPAISHLAEVRWARGYRAWPPRVGRLYADVFDAVEQHTPVGARFLCTSRKLTMLLRYHGMRSMAHGYRDGAMLFYTDIRAVREWEQREEAWEAAVGNSRRAIAGVLRTAGELGAEYVLIDQALPPRQWPDAKVIWQSPDWSLVELRPPHHESGGEVNCRAREREDGP